MTDGQARKTHVSIDGSGQPHDRDWYAGYVRARFHSRQTDTARSIELNSEEAAALILLMDELAGIYATEELGRVAKMMSERLASAVYGE